jgi:thiamine monophosphate synthase
VTEPDCCDSDEGLERALLSLGQAASTGLVDLVIVRVGGDHGRVASGRAGDKGQNEERERRAEALVRALAGWSEEQAAAAARNGGTLSPPAFAVAASSSLAPRTAALAHGVHAKESHRDRYWTMVPREPGGGPPAAPVLGTSAHSVESALDAVRQSRGSNGPGLEYLLVGTCFPTPSHPEKRRPEDVEGPELPGRVRRALSELEDRRRGRRRPWVLGIGGIGAGNCGGVVRMGADGVAVIRAVLASEDPAEAVRRIKASLLRASAETAAAAAADEEKEGESNASRESQ